MLFRSDTSKERPLTDGSASVRHTNPYIDRGSHPVEGLGRSQTLPGVKGRVELCLCHELDDLEAPQWMCVQLVALRGSCGCDLAWPISPVNRDDPLI